MIEVTATAIEPAALQEGLQNPGAGGFCSFEGWVRNVNEGRAVERLEYEAYEPLVIAEGEKVLAEAKAKLPKQAITKIRIPWGQEYTLCRIRSALKMNIKGKMAVRMSYMNP